MKLEFEVRQQTTKLLGNNVLIADSRNYVYAHFNFTEDWDELVKTVFFKQGDSTFITLVLDQNDCCLVPKELLAADGEFTIHLVGSDNNVIITTNSLKLFVKGNDIITGDNTGTPTVDFLTESVTTVKIYRDEAETFASAAEESKDAAALSETNAETSAESAASSAESAASSATSAAASASAAAESVRTIAATESQAKSYAEEAKRQANNAASSATAAAASETNAGLSEDNAQASATAAASSERNAATSASAAAASAATAESAGQGLTELRNMAVAAVENAKGYANSAASSASAAASSESKAHSDKIAAETAAQNASASEANAALSEANAEEYADNASKSATAAETAKTSAAASAKTATDSKDIAVEAKTAAASSALNASASESAAASSAAQAKASETNVANSAANAANSATAAAGSEAKVNADRVAAEKAAAAAKTSETNAKASETKAAASETAASASASAANEAQASAETSASSASSSSQAASTSATAAAASASAAETSETNAAASASDAGESATAAVSAANAAETSKTSASDSASNAQASATSAASSASAAASSATDASTSAAAAAESRVDAALSENNANTYKNNAQQSATAASNSATQATTEANRAEAAADRAEDAATQATTGGVRTVNGISPDLTGNVTIPVYSHPESGVTAGTYRSVTVNAEGHVTAGSNPTTLAGYGITDAKIAGGTITLGSNTITPLTAASSLNANKITGTIDIANLPHGALERCKVVADDTARFALTTADVQAGDTVKVTASGKMYFVVDDSKLSTEAGYEVYTAGTASSVPWSGVTNKPSTFTPAAHNQASNTITAMTGYAKASTAGAISATDSLNTAVGKLEKGLDGKQAAGNYAAADHTHNEMTAATSTTEGTAGFVPAPAAGKQSSYLKGNGTWAVPDNNKVTQTVTTTDAEYPLIATATANQTATSTNSARFAAGVTLNPSTKTLTAENFRGDLIGTADEATKAYQDGSGNTFETTYAKKGEIPVSLPADGGDADTVNGFTVGCNVPANAKFTDTVYTHPSYTAKSAGLYKVTVNNTGHVSATTAVTKADITGLGIPAQDTVYTLPAATATTLGGVKTGSNITNSSGTISLTKANVTSALGYTPSATDTTYSVMQGATTNADGKAGLVPAPASDKVVSFLRGDGNWAIPANTTYSAGTGISLSGTTFSNSGVRSVAAGSYEDTINVNTNGTSTTITINNVANAATANKLGTVTVGASAKPIFLNGGTPTACSSTVGNASTPVYMNAGTFTAVTSVAVNKGGTGATTAAQALQNLGITTSTTDLTAGTSALATGAIYIVYE